MTDVATPKRAGHRTPPEGGRGSGGTVGGLLRRRSRRGGRRDDVAPSRGVLYAGRIAVGVLFLLAWEWSSGRIWEEFSVSRPTAVAERLWDLAVSGELWEHLQVTLLETFIGLVIGLAAGVALGIAIASSRLIGQFFYPYVIALYSLPRVALAPLFIVWFGIGLTSKVVMVVTMVLFVAFYNTYEGIRNIDRDLLEMTRSMRASWLSTLRWVTIPSIMPWVLTSLRLSIGLGLIGAVISELVAASEGIGYYIKLSSNLYDTTGVFAGLIVITLVAMVVEQAVVLLERRLLRYR